MLDIAFPPEPVFVKFVPPVEFVPASANGADASTARKRKERILIQIE